MYRMAKNPQCPHCGDIAPNGDSRLQWMNKHLERRLHRWWWKIRKVVKL